MLSHFFVLEKTAYTTQYHKRRQQHLLFFDLYFSFWGGSNFREWKNRFLWKFLSVGTSFDFVKQCRISQRLIFVEKDTGKLVLDRMFERNRIYDPFSKSGHWPLSKSVSLALYEPIQWSSKASKRFLYKNRSIEQVSVW